MTMPLTSKKSNPTSAKFGNKFGCVFFFFRFSIYYHIEEIRTFSLEKLNSIPLVVLIFKKNNCRGGPVYLVGIHISLRPVDQQQRQPTVRIYSRYHTV